MGKQLHSHSECLARLRRIGSVVVLRLMLWAQSTFSQAAPSDVLLITATPTSAALSVLYLALLQKARPEDSGDVVQLLAVPAPFRLVQLFLP